MFGISRERSERNESHPSFFLLVLSVWEESRGEGKVGHGKVKCFLSHPSPLRGNIFLSFCEVPGP